MIFTAADLLMGRAQLDALPVDHRQNLGILLRRLNKLAAAYGGPLKVNDGYRRPEDQPRNAAKKSRHLTGQAVDLDDDDTAYLWHWVKDHLQLMKDIGFWLESPNWTHGPNGTWCHFQIVPPASGNRIFVPSSAPASAPDLFDGQYDPAFNFTQPTT